MFRNLVNFLKYNNLTVFMVLVIFLLSSGVFAQTEAGQEFIGEKEVRMEGSDNSLLLDADILNMDMNYKIEKIESDDKYYFVTYTYLDLVEEDGAWVYRIQEKVRKVSKKLKKDLGEYLAEELQEERDKRISDLEKEKERALMTGETNRIEVEEYSGIVGQALDIVGRVFEGYGAVKIRKVPGPSIPPTILAQRKTTEDGEIEGRADNLTAIYNDYIEKKDPDKDDVFGIMDNCPNDYNPAQLDGDSDGIGDVCDNDEPVIDDNEVIDDGGIIDPVDDEITTPDDGSSSDEPEHESGETVPLEDVPEETSSGGEETSNTSEESSSSEESGSDPGSESTDNSTVSTATEEPDVVIVEIEE